MKQENIVKDKSFAFAVRIVNLYKYLCEKKQEYIMSKQLMRSGTSIGANVYESGRAVSKKDFCNKLAISQKEADETLYWIELLFATEYIDEKQYSSIKNDCLELIKLLMSIVKTLSQEDKA